MQRKILRTKRVWPPQRAPPILSSQGPPHAFAFLACSKLAEGIVPGQSRGDIDHSRGVFITKGAC
jgi:hypothetical protein